MNIVEFQKILQMNMSLILTALSDFMNPLSAVTNATNDKIQAYWALCILYQVSKSDVQLHWDK